jgi:hypothetical protein
VTRRALSAVLALALVIAWTRDDAGAAALLVLLALATVAVVRHRLRCRPSRSWPCGGCGQPIYAPSRARYHDPHCLALARQRRRDHELVLPADVAPAPPRPALERGWDDVPF